MLSPLPSTTTVYIAAASLPHTATSYTPPNIAAVKRLILQIFINENNQLMHKLIRLTNVVFFKIHTTDGTLQLYAISITILIVDNNYLLCCHYWSLF